MNVELITIELSFSLDEYGVSNFKLELKFSLDEYGVNNYRTQTFIG